MGINFKGDKMKIVILGTSRDILDESAWDIFDIYPEVVKYSSSSQEETLEKIIDSDVVIFNNRGKLRRYEIENAKNLKYIGVLGTGYDKIDIEAAKENDIAVTNIPDYGTDTVAEFTIGMMLTVTKHFEHHSKVAKSGNWRDDVLKLSNSRLPLDVNGKNLGIIGYGRIGKRVGELAKAFNMNIYVLDRKGNYRVKNGTNFVSLDELLNKSDYVTLHPNLTSENEKMVNREFLNKMKPTAYLLNMARGELVDEEALKDALNNEKIAGAAVDTVSVEPIQMDNPLLEAKNIIITPHIAWLSQESLNKILQTTLENLQAFLRGEKLNRIV